MILDSVVDEVSEALSMNVASPAIQIVVVPVGGGLSLSFKTFQKSKVCVCIYTFTFELFCSSLG
jgi:hypothetical protein